MTRKLLVEGVLYRVERTALVVGEHERDLRARDAAILRFVIYAHGGDDAVVAFLGHAPGGARQCQRAFRQRQHPFRPHARIAR